ncbi:right-handed parallel beta-helix repeat-containing protein [bacterium]|nr:right-handed parallel beta-helix repeat-containing protein [bacterium]
MKGRFTFSLLLALAFLAVGCSKNSTESQEGTLKGVVTLEDQQDHSGIVVHLMELGRRSITTADGSYSLLAIPAGTYSLLATDGDTTRYLFDFIIAHGVSVRAERTTTAPTIELPMFQRIEDDLGGQVHWTAEGGPYLITQSVTVLPGSHLSIEAGAVVKFVGYHRLTVQGRLLAKGTTADSILFTTVKIAGSPGDWNRISIQGPKDGPPDTLGFCRIQYANVGLSCQQAAPVVHNNEVCNCFGYGIVADISAPKISGNFLRNNYGGISCENGSAAIIEGNTIQENSFAGIACTNSSPQISDNVISQNKYGLYTERECDPLVWHNHFFSNEDALYLHYYCDPQIEANEISDQQRSGLYLSGYNNPEIHRNNISQNGSYGVYLTYQPDNVQAQNNWWGTNNLNEIGTLIWDVHDNAAVGEVLLNPILEAPVDSAGPRVFP